MNRTPLSASLRPVMGNRGRSISSILGIHTNTARPTVKIMNSGVFQNPRSTTQLLPSLNDNSNNRALSTNYFSGGNALPGQINKELTQKILSLKPDIKQVSQFAIEARSSDSYLCISEETTLHLYNTIGEIIFRPFDDMTYLDEYNDDPFVKSLDVWKDLKNIYSLLQCLITNAFPKATIDWLMNKNAEKLFMNLLSPDPREVTVIESIVLSIFKSWADISTKFVSASTVIIQNFLDGIHTFYGISTVMKFLDLYYRSSSDAWDESSNTLTLTLFIPALLNNFACKYYSPLNRVLSFAYSKNESLAETCLSKMLKSWPVTCSSNIVCFLHHFSSIVTIAGPNKITPYVVPMFNHIIESAKSDNHKVSFSALTISSNVTFIFEFLQTYGHYVRALYSVAEEMQTKHWSEEVRMAAKQALISINNAAPQIKLIPAPNPQAQKSQRLEIWKELSSQCGVELVDPFSQK